MYVPTIGEYDPSMEYTVTGALRMGEDAFSHIGLQITLEEQQVLIPFKLRTVPEGVYNEHIVRVGNHDQEFRVYSHDFEELATICEYVFEMIKEDFDMSLDRWLEQDKSEQPAHAFYPPHPPQDATILAAEYPESTDVSPISSKTERHWITTQEAVQISGYHPEYVRKLARQGRIGAVRKGRDWWIDRDALQEYLDTIESLGTQKFSPKGPAFPETNP